MLGTFGQADTDGVRFPLLCTGEDARSTAGPISLYVLLTEYGLRLTQLELPGGRCKSYTRWPSGSNPLQDPFMDGNTITTCATPPQGQLA